MDKKQLRTFMRDKRKALSTHEQQLAAQQLLQQFLTTSFLEHYQHFALYVAHLGEIDVKPISDSLFQHQKSCYLPVIPESPNRIMHFVAVKEDEKLIANQYGILEPPTRHQVIEPSSLDVVLVPLVAVDQTGFRLGMGKGYYDATFAFKHDKAHQKPLLIGVAYSWQQLNEIPTDDWDIKLDGLLTEKKFNHF